MNETLQIWLFGAAFACIGVGAAFVLSFSVRLTRIETMFDLLGKRAAKFLHSPDDHLGIDRLLELYVDAHHELTKSQWQDLACAMNKITEDPKVSNNEKILAAFLAELCNHKLMIFRKQEQRIDYGGLSARL